MISYDALCHMLDMLEIALLIQGVIVMILFGAVLLYDLISDIVTIIETHAEEIKKRRDRSK